MAPQRLDRLFLVVAKAAASIPHGQRGLGFVRIGLKWLQQCGAYIAKALLAWAPIPLRNLEPCIPSCG